MQAAVTSENVRSTYIIMHTLVQEQLLPGWSKRDVSNIINVFVITGLEFVLILHPNKSYVW